MELLRIVMTYDAKKNTDIGRQTTFIKRKDLKLNKILIKPKGKSTIKEITVEAISSKIKL